MTLGPKFYAKLVSAITRRRMNENQQFLADLVQNFMYIMNPSKKTKWVLCFGGSVWSVLCLASMVENPCERSVGARGGNQAVRTRGGNNRREQEAGRSLRNAAFRAEPKKLCINTTLSINDKTVYKHVFPVLRSIDPKQNRV